MRKYLPLFCFKATILEIICLLTGCSYLEEPSPQTLEVENQLEASIELSISATATGQETYTIEKNSKERILHVAKNKQVGESTDECDVRLSIARVDNEQDLGSTSYRCSQGTEHHRIRCKTSGCFLDGEKLEIGGGF